MLDSAALKKDFPIFERTIRDGQRLVYLDSGATAQQLAMRQFIAALTN